MYDPVHFQLVSVCVATDLCELVAKITTWKLVSCGLRYPLRVSARMGTSVLVGNWFALQPAAQQAGIELFQKRPSRVCTLPGLIYTRLD